LSAGSVAERPVVCERDLIGAVANLPIRARPEHQGHRGEHDGCRAGADRARLRDSPVPVSLAPSLPEIVNRDSRGDAQER
jgi:hypothetical protein